MTTRLSEWLTSAVLTCAMALAGSAVAADRLDEHQFRLLSCDMTAHGSAGHRRALEWMRQFAASAPDANYKVPGPVTFGKACLKNVAIQAAPQGHVIKGEICSASLDEFTDALAAIGTSLGKEVEGPVPTTVLGKASDKGGNNRDYFITKGLWDFYTGRPVPKSGPYAFLCTLSPGAAQ